MKWMSNENEKRDTLILQYLITTWEEYMFIYKYTSVGLPENDSLADSFGGLRNSKPWILELYYVLGNIFIYMIY